jgi:hypothetical protein
MVLMSRLRGACGLAFALMSLTAQAQVIEFESNGLRYQTLTKSGVTVMYATLPARLREYTIIQVSVSNGAEAPYVVRPEDFTFMRDGAAPVRASAANSVVQMLTERGSRNDVPKLVSAYEASLYNVPNMRITNGYEERRQAAMMAGSSRLRAAAEASALALVQTKLAPGESTDGAVFFQTDGKPLTPGRLVVRTSTDSFEFKPQ